LALKIILSLKKENPNKGRASKSNKVGSPIRAIPDMVKVPGNLMESALIKKDFTLESFEQLTKQYTPMIHKIINSLHIYKNRDEFFQN
jgi:hypothetical protein